MAETLGQVPKPWFQASYAYMMALADDENAETAISQALKALDEIPVTIDPEVLLTRADLGLYRGQAAEARELIGQLRALARTSKSSQPESPARR